MIIVQMMVSKKIITVIAVNNIQQMKMGAALFLIIVTGITDKIVKVMCVMNTMLVQWMEMVLSHTIMLIKNIVITLIGVMIVLTGKILQIILQKPFITMLNNVAMDLTHVNKEKMLIGANKFSATAMHQYVGDNLPLLISIMNAISFMTQLMMILKLWALRVSTFLNFFLLKAYMFL